MSEVGVPMSSFGAAGGGTYILEKHKTSHAIDCHQLGIWHSEKMVWSTFWPIMSVVLLEPHLVLCHPLTSRGTVNMKQDASSDRHNRINGVVRNRRHSRQLEHQPEAFMLTSETGWNVAIAPSGRVYSGTDADRNSRLLLHTIDQGVYTIQGQASGRYLAFSDRGAAISTPEVSALNYFLAIPTPHHYEMFLSQRHRHHGWYLGITRSGRLVRHRPSRQTDSSRTNIYSTRLRTFSFLQRLAQRR